MRETESSEKESEMRDLLIIFLTGMIGVTKAIPVGIALRTPPLLVFLMTVCGAYTAAAAIYTGHGWIGRLLAAHADGNRMKKRKKRIHVLASKYGIAGLGIIGTVLFGANVTFLLGLAVVDRKKTLAVWVAAGIALWAAVVTAAGTVGFGFAVRSSLFRHIGRLAGVPAARGGSTP
jgi:hypothetical protein